MLFLLLVLVGPAHATVEFSLLRTEGLREEQGLLLAIVDGVNVYGVTPEALKAGANPSKICLFLGYHDAPFRYDSHIQYEIPEDSVKELARGISKVSCMSYAIKPEDCYIEVVQGSKLRYDGNLTVVSCGEPLNPAEYEIRDFFTIQEASRAPFLRNPGVAMVELRSKDSPEEHYGFICSADKRAADLACEHLGYKEGSRNISRNNFTYISRDILRYFDFKVQRVTCGDAHEFSQCLVDYTSAMDCREGDELVVECEGEAVHPDPELDHVLLMSDGGGEFRNSNRGVVQVVLKDKRLGAVLHADYRATELACQRNGYETVRKITYNQDFRYLSRRVTEMADFVVKEAKCPRTAEKLEDCSFTLVSSKDIYINDKQLVIACGKHNDTEPKHVDMIYLASDKYGELSLEANPGVIFVKFDDGSYGFGYSANKRAMDLICQRLGFRTANFTDLNHDFRYISSKYVEGATHGVYRVLCSEDATDFGDCDVKIYYYSPYNDKQLVIGCSADDGSDDDDSDDDDSDDDSDDGAGYVEVDFGGAELNIDLNPQKIHIDIEDIIDEILN